jgi:hypothetical protein
MQQIFLIPGEEDTFCCFGQKGAFTSSFSREVEQWPHIAGTVADIS